MNLLIVAISSVLEFFCLYIPAKKFAQTSLRPSGNDLIACLILAIPSTLIPDAYGTLLWITGQVLYMIYFLSQYKGKLLNRFFLFLLSYGSVIICQYLVIILVAFLPVNTASWYMPILGNFLTMLVVFCFFQFTRIYKIYPIIVSSSLPLRLIILNTYLVFVSVLLLNKLDLSHAYDKSAYLFSLVILLLAANTCMIYYERRLDFQKTELLSYQKNLPIYETLIHEIRAHQHEYVNHLQTLRTLPNTCPDYESLCNALSGYASAYSTPQRAYPLLTLNMPLLAASLYNLAAKAEEQGISILFDITSSKLESTVPEHILTDFVCILTQNAIEASKSGDTIYTLVSSDNGTTHFEIRNPSDVFYTREQVNRFFQKGYTTKEPSRKSSKKTHTPHGYGLYQLLSKVNKLNGIVGADCIKFEEKYWMIFRLEI